MEQQYGKSVKLVILETASNIVVFHDFGAVVSSRSSNSYTLTDFNVHHFSICRLVNVLDIRVFCGFTVSFKF